MLRFINHARSGSFAVAVDTSRSLLQLRHAAGRVRRLIGIVGPRQQAPIIRMVKVQIRDPDILEAVELLGSHPAGSSAVHPSSDLHFLRQQWGLKTENKLLGRLRLLIAKEALSFPPTAKVS